MQNAKFKKSHRPKTNEFKASLRRDGKGNEGEDL